MPRWLRRLLPYLEYRYFRYIARTFSFGPPIFGGLILLLLWLPDQMSQVYLSVIEAADYGRGLLGLAFLMLLSALLFCWHLFLATPRIDAVYVEFPDIRFDHRLIALRDAKAFGCATLPLAGLVLGLIKLGLGTENLCKNYSLALEALQLETPSGCVSFDGYTIFTIKIAVAAALVVVAAMILWTLLLPYLERSTRGRKWVVGISAAIALLAGFGPVIGHGPIARDLVVTVAWWLGPLVAVLAVLVSAATVLMALSWFSERTHFPFTAVLFLTAIVMGTFGIRQNITSQATQEANAGGASISNNSNPLWPQFKDWLDRRNDRQAFADRPYPVFIVAAQGGGIYAASAALNFLSALQDACPAFAEHIFAISGVSGGAVGATIFHGFISEERSPDSSDCPHASTRLAANAERVVLSDHLSPVVALVLPDLLRELMPGSADDWDRAAALEHSLVCAFKNRSSQALLPWCNSHFIQSELDRPFDEHWRNAQGPALVLNTTWVETGFRAAFAPSGMQLHAAGDGTLYAFSDFHQDATVNLIQAAVASARFPLIAPAWPYPQSNGHLWNFVDGGYADNSGATTALEIYKSLDKSLQGSADLRSRIDLRLIVLTDAAADPQLSKINGRGFNDTLAPITALLNVRSQLASRAVTQATSFMSEIAGQAGDSKILLVKLEQRAFRLPLGWEISHAENDVVKFMLGRADICERSANVHASDSVAKTIVDNSCVRRKIELLLSGQKADADHAVPAPENGSVTQTLRH
jgi:hypothetical protein